MLFASGEKEYHAAKEQPGRVKVGQISSGLDTRNELFTEGRPCEEEDTTVLVDRIEYGQLLRLAVQWVDRRVAKTEHVLHVAKYGYVGCGSCRGWRES